MEQPGAVNFNMETLIRSAASCGVGLVVRFVPFSEMLRWENGFSQDSFDVVPINEDTQFIAPTVQDISMASNSTVAWFSGTIVNQNVAKTRHYRLGARHSNITMLYAAPQPKQFLSQVQAIRRIRGRKGTERQPIRRCG